MPDLLVRRSLVRRGKRSRTELAEGMFDVLSPFVMPDLPVRRSLGEGGIRHPVYLALRFTRGHSERNKVE